MKSLIMLQNYILVKGLEFLGVNVCTATTLNRMLNEKLNHNTKSCVNEGVGILEWAMWNEVL